MTNKNRLNNILNILQNIYSTENATTITPTRTSCYKATTSWTAQRALAAIKYNITSLQARILGRTQCASLSAPNASWGRQPPSNIICTRHLQTCNSSGCPQDYINTSWNFSNGSGTEFLNDSFTGLSISFGKETTVSSIKGSKMSYGLWKNCPNTEKINGCSFSREACPRSSGCINVNKVGASSVICSNFFNPQTRELNSKTETFFISAWDKRYFSGIVYNYGIEITIKYNVNLILSSTWLRLSNPNHNCGSCAVSPTDAAVYLSTPDFDNTNDLLNIAQNLSFERAVSLKF
jgi:hypothetical protein